MLCPDFLSPRLRSPRFWGLVLIAVCGLALRGWGLDFGLPNDSVPAESETSTVVLANMLTPFFQQGDLSLNPGTVQMPGLYADLIAVIYAVFYTLGRSLGWFGDWQAYLLAWQNDPTIWHLLQRGVAVISGVAMIPLGYLLGKQAADRQAGLWMATLLAGSYLLIRTSHFGMAAMPATALVLLALLLYARFHRKRSMSALWLACGVTGLAIGMHYLAVALLPMLLLLLLNAGPSCEGQASPLKRMGKPLLLVIAVFLLTTPWLALDATAGTQLLNGFQDHYGYITGWTGWRFYPVFALYEGLGAWVLVFCALGLWRAWRTSVSAEQVWHQSFAGYGLALALVLGMQTRPDSTQACLLAPFVMFYAALGMQYGGLVMQRALKLGEVQRSRGGVSVMVLLVALYQPVSLALSMDRVLTQPDSRVLARQVLMQQVPPGAAIATGPWVGRMNLPLQYGQLMVDTTAPPQESVQIRAVTPRTQVASSFDFPDMFKDLGVRYVVLYRGQPRLANTEASWRALSEEARVVYRGVPQKPGRFDWQLTNDPPKIEPFLPIYLPLTGLVHFNAPGPELVIFEMPAVPDSGS